MSADSPPVAITDGVVTLRCGTLLISDSASVDFTLTPTATGATLTATAAGGASGALALNQHVLVANFTITAGWTAYITRYLEVAVGFTLEIGLDGDLEIG